MIGLGLSVRAESGNRAELHQSLENLRREQRNGQSCVECRVYEDIADSGCFLWMQWWRSPQGLEEHMQSAGFGTLLGAVKVLGELESARIVELQDATSVMGAFLAGRVDVNPTSQKI